MTVVQRRILVAGTGTEVGKTVFTARLVADARDRGVDAVAVKPLETGPEATADSVALGKASGRRVAPWFRGDDPVSPHLAARRAGRRLEAEEIAAWVEQPFAEVVVVESAGGLFSPISEVACNADWMDRVGWSARVLVCPGRLGVLHDVGAVVRSAGPGFWSLLVVSAVAGVEEAEAQAAELRVAVLGRLGLELRVEVCDPTSQPWPWLAGTGSLPARSP